MRTGRLAVLAGLAAFLLTGCAAQRIASDEQFLAAAGFTVRPANTPARAASLQRLPPGELMMAERKGKPVWLYADPVHCNCLYVGGQTAYRRYADLKVRQRIAETNLQAAQLARMNWQWGIWGPWPMFGPFWAPY
ncbi:MAG: hypothetical protein ACREFY_12775 [Acetobacteraceae bacterium]